MQRITNRHVEQSSEPIVQIKYIEIPQEVAPQAAPEPVIQYVDREVIKEVFVQTDGQSVDLQPVLEQLNEQRAVQAGRMVHTQKSFDAVKTALDMQSRALVALKTQRDIDRSRRLMLIKRMKKERNEANKMILKFKLAIGASLLLSIVSLIVKL